MSYVNKTTVVSTVLGLAIFGAAVYFAKKSSVPAVANAANIVK